MLTRPKIQTRPPSNRGFTLTELLIVMVLLSILSATALPALARLDRAQRAGLLNECERLIMLSRSRAISTGLPTAVRFDLTQQTASVLTLEADTPGVTEVIRTGTGQGHTLSVANFPGTRIELAGPENSPSTLGVVALWFDLDGTPQLREPDGESPVPLQNDFLVQIEDGPQLSVSAWGGMVTR